MTPGEVTDGRTVGAAAGRDSAEPARSPGGGAHAQVASRSQAAISGASALPRVR